MIRLDDAVGFLSVLLAIPLIIDAVGVGAALMGLCIDILTCVSDRTHK